MMFLMHLRCDKDSSLGGYILQILRLPLARFPKWGRFLNENFFYHAGYSSSTTRLTVMSIE